MIIDTHIHLYHERYDADREDVISRARAVGVGVMVMPAIDLASIAGALDLARHHEGLYAMAALHPSETREATDADFDEVVRRCEDPKIVAVGESGLDYYWDRSFDDRQQYFLRMHIRLAIEKELPLILHNREADGDLFRILMEERARSGAPERLRGIFHCFQSDLPFARQVTDAGFLLGIGGSLTFKNSTLRDVLADVPLEHIVLETDGPFLAPVPHRGKRNEPAYLPLIAETLAAVKGTTVSEVEHITTENARGLFGIDGGAV